VTRFKELQRIRQALKNSDLSELKWASDYCRTRLQISARKDHAKTWRKLLSEVEEALVALPRKR
jgi:hypothetical protein